MRWPPTHSFPCNAGYVAWERLPIRHYPHRDPEQLRRRCQLRSLMLARYHDWTQPEAHYWAENNWREFITPDSSSELGQMQARIKLPEHLPKLYHWTPGTKLPEFHFTSHLRSPQVRLIQRLVHTFCLPLLDRTRAKWAETDYPQKIPADMVAVLERELAR